MNLCKFSIIVLSLAIIVYTEAQPKHLDDVCSNIIISTRDTTYQTNLKTLLSSLSSNGTFAYGFYTASAGQHPNDIYGLFLYHGDSTTAVCRDCVTFATQDILQRCLVDKLATVWYDQCFVRYSNLSLFSVLDQTFTVYITNPQNIAQSAAEQEHFNKLVDETVTDAVAEVSRAASGAKKFAVKEVNFQGDQNLYTLAQCTLDLSALDCNTCLQSAITNLPKCCSGKRGGRVLYPSCNIRYEVYPFYNATRLVRPPPPPTTASPPPAASPSRHKGI